MSDAIIEQESASNATSLLIDDIGALWRIRKRILLSSFALAVAVYGGSWLVKPTFTATTVFLPPQQSQGTAASALASLSALSSLTGASVGTRGSLEQYSAFLKSAYISDRVISKFQLRDRYQVEYQQKAREALAAATEITIGKKEGLISISVHDKDPAVSAEIANQYVEELRSLTSKLVLTEAQNRRTFFERQLASTKIKLMEAQSALQSSGFSAGALRAEPKSTAEGFAKLKAELTAAEVKLQGIRSSLADQTPEVQQQASIVAALKSQVVRSQGVETSAGSDNDYIAKYREYKYQESLFEIYSRQFEIARLDEGRESMSLQVIDKAEKPELKSKPRRGLIGLSTLLAAIVGQVIFFFVRRKWAEFKESGSYASMFGV